MTQTRIDSFMEALTNVAVGFTINFAANLVILPAVLGVEVSLAAFGIIGILYTVVSVARSYALRRLFNGRSVWASIRSLFSDDPDRKSPIHPLASGVEQTRNAREGRLIKGT